MSVGIPSKAVRVIIAVQACVYSRNVEAESIFEGLIAYEFCISICNGVRAQIAISEKSRIFYNLRFKIN